ncbi:MAG TPA: methionine synthase [Phycisphaerae bacterium]|nr:methionine synthase [Phycisphaerae bacterium]HOJ74707.1 methionine synthase [Phycisphaerae bacterium]HOM52076.1 methionine synthase [Phycisphaerae bacterium]HPP28759.1 methionine synthase [Phycisphaerae bacterium]HPU26685.1 methionine synthase [Phycisphaerae bacterium]
MENLFRQALNERVLVFDGAMGTSVHSFDLPLSDFAGLENCTEILSQTRPDVIGEVHERFLRVGCDAVETNTFGANKIVLAEFGLADRTYELNRISAEIARRACEKYSTPDRPRFVVGSMGPGTKLVSLRQTTFDILEDSYAEQARGLLAGGVDVLLVETAQDILQCKAAIAGIEKAFAEAGRRVPLMVQVTMETTGTMLVGTDIAAAVVALEAYPQIDVIGLNCATGPQEMSEHVRYLSQFCTRKLSVLPNAGLPLVVEGRPHYPLSPEELTRWLVEFVEQDGVNIVGGCCGTTPDHIAALVKAVGGRAPKQREPRFEPSVSSLYQAVPIRQDNSFLIVGERTNANGSKKFRELLAAEDVDGMVRMAKEQVKAGSHMIDVCAAYVGRDEVSDMRRIIARFATEVPVPLMIDSTETPVIEESLKLAGGKCIVNSINLEDGEKRCAEVLPLCRKFGAAVVALTIDEEGMAKTADRKVAIARRIYRLVTENYGIAPGDLLFDPLTFTICTGNEDDRRLGLETLEAIRRIKQEMPDCHILLGVSNISFGVKPAVRHVLNSVFLHYAREAGLDAAIVHAGGIQPLYKIDEKLREIARKLIFDERSDGYDPLADLLAQFPDDGPKRAESTRASASVEERLKQRIIDGDRTGLTDDLDEALTRYRPLEIVNDILLDGMKTVGDLFGAGEMQLPFVLQSAETMKAAVAYLEPHMEKTDEGGKGSIVLATVKGDVHDIGKNLVDILLTNNGYTVYNLGIKQPINAIIDAWQEKKADAIGMSGLLVKSTIVMRDNLAVLNERGLTPPVILGGAALTRKYVEQDLRPLYKGPLMYAKDAFEGLHLMRAIVEGEIEREEARPRSQLVSRTEAAAIAAGPVRTQRSDDIAVDVPVPTPPFWGSRVVEHIPLKSVLAYINEVMLFQVQWEYRKKGRPQAEFDRYIDTEVRPIYRELAAQCEREGILQPRAVYGYWPCQSEGNTLYVYDPDDRDKVIAEFEFPRQAKEPYWCLADFWRPRSSGEFDVIAMTIVTVGRQASEVAREWFAQNRYRDYLHLHGLGVEAAEALAEYMHKQVRVELGIAGEDAREIRDIFRQGYRGSRYSFGYPACPDVAAQEKMWPLLQPDRIGVSLSEEYMLDPEQSTSAIIAHHPQAKYFKA